MKKLALTLAACLPLLLVSCNKEQDYNSFEGTWRLTGFIIGEPENDGYLPEELSAERQEMVADMNSDIASGAKNITFDSNGAGLFCGSACLISGNKLTVKDGTGTVEIPVSRISNYEIRLDAVSRIGYAEPGDDGVIKVKKKAAFPLLLIYNRVKDN